MIKSGGFPLGIARRPTSVRGVFSYHWVSSLFAQLGYFLYNFKIEILLLLVSLSCAALFYHNDSKSHVFLMLALGFAALTSSIAGFAFSAIGGAVLFHLSTDTVKIVQIMMICSVCNQFSMVWRIRREINFIDLKPFLFSGMLGVGVGVELLLFTDRATFIHLIGGFLVIYSTYMILQGRLLFRVQHPMIDFAVGFMSGVAGGVVGFPGAFIVPWASLKGWDKQRQRCLFQPFILIMQILALTTISISARMQNSGASFDVSNLLFVPFSVLCTSVGMRLYGALSDRQFTMAINFLLLISGVVYLL